jgi:hypothetical protein
MIWNWAEELIRRRCRVCDEPGASTCYLGGPRLERLWAGKHLFGWREAA